MASGYRNSAGVDFDNLFEPGAVTAPGFRRSDGSLLAYAARGSVPKGPNVGFRDAGGSDLSNLWLPVGSGPPAPGFAGKSYSANAIAPTGATGTTSGTVTLSLSPDGTWRAERALANAVTPGTTVLESGTWLPAGQSAADYTIQFTPSAGTGNGTVTNGAASPMSLAQFRSIALRCSVGATSGQDLSDSRAVNFVLARTGGGASSGVFTLTASAASFA